jgi:hypothetical protein
MKIFITEDFDFDKFTISKGSPCTVKDIKLVDHARTGIGVLVEFEASKPGAEGKILIEDWIDLGLVFPLKNHFTVPHGVQPNEYREKNLEKEDKNIIDTWKDMISMDSKSKVLKSIETRLTSSKFGI